MISGIPISTYLLDQLNKKLNVGNLRSIQLNCVPGRSLTKLDICDTKVINSSLPEEFVDKLLNHKKQFSFSISFNTLDFNIGSEDEEKQKSLGLLSKRLNRLNTQNKEDYQEYGYESFGFGFPIVVFRPQEDPDKLIRAPLFIWHLSIKKDLSKSNTWNISRSIDQEIEFNNLLRSYCGELSNVKIQGFDDDELKDGVLDFEELIQNVKKFLKYFQSFDEGDLDNKLRESFKKEFKSIPSSKELKNTASSKPTIYWGGVFGRYHLRNEAIRQEMKEEMFELLEEEVDENEEYKDANIDPLMHPETAALTDPSQLSILNYLKENDHVIIQGPPGTGKSESITGIIINALEHGSTCLVVCEKKTAMEVLKKNLNAISPEIGKMATVIEDVSTDRKSVVNSIRDRYEQYGHKTFKMPPSSNLTEKLELIEDKIRDIHNRKQFLNEAEIIQSGDHKGWTQAVGKQLQARHSNGQLSLKEKLDQKDLDIESINYQNDINFLKEFEQKSRNLNFQNSLFFISDKKINENSPVELKEELSAILVEETEPLKKFIEGFKEHLDTTKELIDCEVKDSLQKIEKLYSRLENIYKLVSLQRLFKKDNLWFKTIKIVKKLSSTLTVQVDAFLEVPTLIEALNSELSKFRREYQLDSELSIEALANNLTKLEAIETELNDNVNSIQRQLFNELVDKPFCGISLNWELYTEFEKWRSKANRLKEEHAKISSNIIQSDLYEQLDHLNYFLECSESFNHAKATGFFDHFEWQKEIRRQSKSVQEIILTFIENKSSSWDRQFDEFYIDKKLKKKFSPLTGSYEAQLKILKGERDQIVQEIKDRIPKYWRAKQSNANKDVNIPKLYNKRGSRGKRRNSLRKIAKRSFSSLTSYFPVLMVSPSVCASMFDLKPNLFDYVIFDEASQLKTEESLSTLIRGKRKVVSGDKNQMPPSYWFTKVNTDDLEIDEEEDYDPFLSFNEELESREGAFDLANSESLLEFAELCGFQSYHLDFHYRSHHPLLIEFSNAAFYKSRLNPLPERINQSPIQFIPVNGISLDQQNKEEANLAVEILKRIKRDDDGNLPTVGIATFNRKQKNLVWEILKREIRLDQEFNTRFREYEENGLFVKNLENIQGDERDIIILSTTFGPDENGDFSRFYGPLNRNGLGRRLLNVIITRAKKKIFVLTSVPNNVYMNYRQELGGGRDMERGYFHAYLAYAKAVSEKDIDTVNSVRAFLRNRTQTTQNDFYGLTESPFEEAVYQALAEEIDPERIILQHKTGGFRIDIAVKSKVTGREFIAIECDGAAYHKSAEDHAWDSYRQDILEKHGFVFHRIWSRDWWENSERQLKKLVQFIHQQDEKDPGYQLFDDPAAENVDLEPLLEQAGVFVEEEVVEKDSSKQEKKKKTDEEIDAEELREIQLQYEFTPKQKVEIGKVVTLKYLESGKVVKIKLSKNVNGITENNGVQILDEKSPIGAAILGERIGETIEIGNLEKYCKILNIE